MSNPSKIEFKGRFPEMMPKDNDYLNNGGPETNIPEAESAPETLDLEQALAAEKKKAEEYLASWQRAQADFINFKRRTEQEKQELGKYANATLFCDILPVLDDLERALDAVPDKYAKSDWVEGVRLVERKFKNILDKQGVKPVCALGMAFDPNFHEAIRQDKGPEGMVVAEFQKGYTLNDKLIRPSRVVVGSGEEDGPEIEKE
jgi:molecular chaperone GrpE